MSGIVSNKVDVLLATYNGAAYIHDFLQSLSVQSYTDFNIIVSDDGSSDGTLRLFKEYSEKFSLAYRDVSPEHPYRSSKNNFERLLAESTSQFVMLADQDDVWLPDKIEKAIARLRQLQEGGFNDVPCMVFTDLEVVDQDLTHLNPSMMRHQRLDPKLVDYPKRILCQNVVAGCTVAMNREAVAAALPFTKEPFVHDHWIALKVSLNGRIAFLDEATLKYRQHTGNQLGFKEAGLRYFIGKIVHVYKFINVTKKVAVDAGIEVSVIEILLTKVSLVLKRIMC